MYLRQNMQGKTARRARRNMSVVCALVLLWLGVHHGWAQDATHPKPFLWTVTTTTNVVYLLGSLHVLKPGDYPLHPAIEQAYTASRTVVFEVDPDTMDTPQAQRTVLATALYPEGETLEQHLSSESYALLKTKVADIGMPLSMFHRYKPWFCAVTLTALTLQKLEFDPAHGIDRYFFNKAKTDRKSILPLETFEDQIHLFSVMTGKNQEAFLRQALQELDLVGSMTDELLQAWKTGDAATLDRILTSSFADYPALYHRLLVQRNKAWMQTIIPLLQRQENVLIVVGAGHLGGPQGLVALLRKQGYTVAQHDGEWR